MGIIITINLPEDYLNAIEILKNAGVYESRSDCIRQALETFLKKDLKFQIDLNSSKLTELTEFSKNLKRKKLQEQSGVYI